MNTKTIAGLLLAISASIVTPAFASGYGPAPSYRPAVGAPASQQGQNAQTVAAEHANTADSVTSYGGVATERSQSSVHDPVSGPRSIYFGR